MLGPFRKCARKTFARPVRVVVEGDGDRTALGRDGASGSAKPVNSDSNLACCCCPRCSR
jgi:hypothetical protein